MSKSKATDKAGLREVAKQVSALASRCSHIRAAECRDELKEFSAHYTSLCIGGSRCLEDEATTALPGIGMSAGELALAGAFVEPNPVVIADALSQFIAGKYLHYRSLRCFYWQRDRASLYAIFMDDLGFAACAAIMLGADREAQWLSSEYIRHIDSGFEDPYTTDTEFATFCRWVTGRYLGRNLEGLTKEICPMYYGLIDAAQSQEIVGKLIDQVLDERTTSAYREVVLEEEVEKPRYFGQLFPALFPFEVLAYQRLVEAKNGQAVHLNHPAIMHLKSVRFLVTHQLAAFASAAESRISRLEQEVQLGRT